jgi:hypothetical protein
VGGRGEQVRENRKVGHVGKKRDVWRCKVEATGMGNGRERKVKR